MNYTDLDFFQPERERLLQKRKKMIPLVILAVFLILILLVIIYLQTTQAALTKELAEKETQVTEMKNEISTVQDEIKAAQATINRFENDANGEVNELDDVVIKEINAEHLQAITTSTPKEAFYSNFRFEENVLTLEGYALNTQVVAKIVYNLESTGLYENVLVTSITNDENKNYKFIISADIKE